MKTIKSNKKTSLLRGLFFFFFSLFVSGVLFSCAQPEIALNTEVPPPQKIQNPKILLINSNAEVEKYSVVQEEFRKTVSCPVLEIDLGDKKENYDIIKLLSYNADLVYCIGGKAYSFAGKYFNEKDIVFSSIINWLRLPSLSQKVYGVSNELHARMPIFMFRSVFPDIKKIGMLYSQQYTSQWFEKSREQASELGIEIIGSAVSDKASVMPALRQLLSEADAIWLISDPLVISEKKYLFEILKKCDTNKTPVFSYHDAFAKSGAVLTVSVDTPTIGRQAANIVMGILAGEKIDEKVQFPAGSHIILNLKKVKAYGLKYNKNALGLINNIIK
ncbi:ABC transporter substrate-binding protein [Desulfonema magnum]|uniref:ABC transporter, substrate-binding protein n=1 Tax=Desulfonema magnum TaxID=45655 RepID=A0A975GSX4_9BACT|nr:ABC transporter substrate binding protein [Desulfonema magnum]QTA91528.1 putative ABC transporter, substrate-binding protein [Desulfonema magnum]